MLEIISKNLNIDFVGKRYVWFCVSLVAIVASIGLLATKGLNYGIDFTGGASVQMKFQKTYGVGELRSLLGEAGFKNLVIQQVGEANQNEFRVKYPAEAEELQAISARTTAALETVMTKDQFEILSVDVVGPAAGEELRKSGYLSMFYALLSILIYVAIRFEFRFSPGVILALMHDTLITVGIFALTQKEFTLQIVAAILTIIGYSNNDSIIVYDRIRETLKLYPSRSLGDNINKAINDTLSRTIVTSITTLLVIGSLMVYGGGIIHDFAFTMGVGVIVGTYSSIFIASPMLMFLSKMKVSGKKKVTHNQKMADART